MHTVPMRYLRVLSLNDAHIPFPPGSSQASLSRHLASSQVGLPQHTKLGSTPLAVAMSAPKSLFFAKQLLKDHLDAAKHHLAEAQSRITQIEEHLADQARDVEGLESVHKELRTQLAGLFPPNPLPWEIHARKSPPNKETPVLTSGRG